MTDKSDEETKAIEPTDLVIRLNTALTNDPCALCGQPTDPTGIDLYLAEKPALVCNAFVRAEYEMYGVQTDEKHF